MTILPLGPMRTSGWSVTVTVLELNEPDVRAPPTVVEFNRLPNGPPYTEDI